MGMIKITDRQFSQIINHFCSCGGRGPNDDPCPACGVHHAVMADQDHSTAVYTWDHAVALAYQRNMEMWEKIKRGTA